MSESDFEGDERSEKTEEGRVEPRSSSEDEGLKKEKKRGRANGGRGYREKQENPIDIGWATLNGL